MRIIFQISIISFFVSIFFSSCTIEKRRYTKGFHIESSAAKNNFQRKRLEQTKESKVETSLSDSTSRAEKKPYEYSDEEIESLKTLSTSLDENVILETHPIAVLDDKNSILESQYKPLTVKTKINNAIDKLFSKTKNDTSNTDESRKINILALLSLLFSVTLFLSPLGLLLGVLALNQFSEYPEKYKGKWMAIVGVSIGTLVLFLLLLTIIVIAITLG